MHIDVVGLAAPAQLGDVAVGRRPGLRVCERKGLLHAAAAQVNGCNGVLLGLAQVAQQVVEGQPGKRALISACSPWNAVQGQSLLWLIPYVSLKKSLDAQAGAHRRGW